MIYTAIYWSTCSGEFSRAVVFNASYDKEDAWNSALEMLGKHEWEMLVCLVPGSHETWAPCMH